MTKARREALQLPEILEQIISYLPGYTILTRAQRVSKLWNTVINTSPIVQKKLWLRPRGARVSRPTGISTKYDIHYPMPVFAMEALLSGVPIYTGSFQINTLFSRIPLIQALHHNRDLPARFVNTAPLPRGKLIWTEIRRFEAVANNSKRPTWLNMHLTEPPITTAWIEVVIEDHSARHPRETFNPATIRNDGGLTFRSVIDVVDRMMALPAWEILTKSISMRICFVADKVEVLLPIGESLKPWVRIRKERFYRDPVTGKLYWESGGEYVR
jgi:hypothetical protein